MLLDSVSKTGGHLSSNLGTVELTLALHQVFDTPHDRIVWDVGHQSYPHNVMTGRRGNMPGLRQIGGISGFPRRDESRVRHLRHRPLVSTSISAALGMAHGRQASRARAAQAVAIIGDGAMTGGHGLRGAQQRRRLPRGGLVSGRRRPIAGDPERQRHVRSRPPVGAPRTSYLGAPVAAATSTPRPRGRENAAPATPLHELARRFEAHQGHGRACTIFPRIRVQLRGPDRRA